MDVFLILLVLAFGFGTMVAVGGMIATLVSGAWRALSGDTAADRLVDALHAQRVLMHFELMRDAALA